MKFTLGRHIYGLAAIGFGICALVWHDFGALGGVAYPALFINIAAAIAILGGAAVQWPRTARIGALALGVLYLIFALLGLPFIVAHPLVYYGYGNFFEQFSLVAGATIIYAYCDPIPSTRTARLARTGYYAFGICVLSFGLEQYFYLHATAGAVPTWIPPGQMFWAVATTIAFVLAAVALLTGLLARLASRLNAAMIVGFGLLVWVPALFVAPRSFTNWSEGIETLGIAASAWLVVAFLDRRSA
jgi:hypothetical protein